jgi:hypothetical protein
LENIYKPVYVHRWLVMLVKFNYPSAWPIFFLNILYVLGKQVS